MKEFDETIQKIRSHYVKDDYIQIMLAYRDYLVLYGNKNLMYFKNYIEKKPILVEGNINVYLNDERKEDFPYSQIPEHIERVLLFRKMNFANQILDFEKPYIGINDGLITKMTAYKDGDETLVHTKILNGRLYNHRTKEITREEIENYLKTGSLEQLDEEEFECIGIFDMNGILYNSGLESEQIWIDQEKERLTRIINKNGEYRENTKIELQKAIAKLDDIEPFTVTQKAMIKFKENGEIKIDCFVIKYEARGKYKIILANLPITMESLSMLKSKSELPVIKTLKEPRISLLLNPNVTREQLQEEKSKILTRTK